MLSQLAASIVSANTRDYRYQKAFKVQRLSLTEGLSQSAVQDVIQDQDGYIWMATEDGLNRFDSYEFKVYRHDHRNKNSLHENWVISLLEEPGVGIWVGTVAGLSFYNPENHSFTDYSAENSDLRTYIHSFVYSENGVVWVATDNGLFYVNREQDQVLPFVSSEGEKIENTVTSLTESPDYLYLAGAKCIYRIEKRNYHLLNLCDNPQLKPLRDLELTVLKIQDNLLWIGSKSGLFRYDIKADSIKAYLNDKTDRHSISDDYIQDLVLDKNSSLWIATTEGLNLYNKNKKIFEHYMQQNFADEGLSSNDVISLYIDNEDLIWLGTYGGGVNILDPNQHQFEHLLTKTDVLTIGNNNTIHGIEKDKYDTLWLASYGGGLIGYDLLTGKISRPLNDSGIEYDKFVYSLLIDYSNRLWVGSLKELTVVDLKSKHKIKTQFIVDGIEIDEFNGVYRIHEDHQSSIWIGAAGGLYKITDLHQVGDILRISLIDLTPKLPHSFTNYRTDISSIVNDQDGNFWFGGSAGLVYYQVKQDEWSHFTYDKRNARSLTNDNVQVIFEDSQGFLWIGTADGLNRVIRFGIDSKTFYFERITTYEGLPNNSIYGILEDEEQQLWISTNLGIVRYAGYETNMDVFRRVDGLSSDEFNTGAYFSDSDGRLYFGSINGITIVNNVFEEIKVVSKRILFTHVRVGERNIDIYQLNHTPEPLIIQHSDEVAIDIAVANINFDKLGTQRYRYRILGLDDKWNYLGTRRNMFIAGLAEGRYQLEVQSQLAGQPWTNQITRLKLIVETSFWSSNRAYYLIGFTILILFAASLFFMARFYQKKINKSNKKISIETLRIRELRLDNDSLKKGLDVKEKEVVSLHRRVRVGDRQLDVEKYRDVTTGFYRLNYLYRIDLEDIDSEGLSGEISGCSWYKAMAIFELNNYVKIHQTMGPLAAAELASKVSVTIRQKLDAGIQVFCIQNGIFLIISSESNCQQFEDNLLNLRHLIVRSKYDVANGLSGNSAVSLTFLEITKSEISTKTELISMVNLLIQAHRQLVNQDEGKNIRIVTNKKARYFIDGQTDWNLESLLNKEILDVKEI